MESSIQDSTPFCETHKAKKNMICVKCKAIMCIKCTIEHYALCSSTFLPIETEKDSMKKKWKQNEDKLKELSSKFEEKRQKLMQILSSREDGQYTYFFQELIQSAMAQWDKFNKENELWRLEVKKVLTKVISEEMQTTIY